ncbi:type II toxin-antitoxin system CcdA family antitoxin [Pseudomonas viridiflava]|uniref:type II toxin-antitoxin system CcdA family antitoxin n=2 Tax=Pseudomonas viridiflava TaxID=33069 RepID=UPI003C12FFF4
MKSWPSTRQVASWKVNWVFHFNGDGMMTGPSRIAGNDGYLGSSHATDSPDALPLKIEQQGLQGEGQTREQWLQENRHAMKLYNEYVEKHGGIQRRGAVLLKPLTT